MNLVKFENNTAVYWVSGWETLSTHEYTVTIDGKDSSKYFPNTESAWKYAKKLACNNARRTGREAIYTTHPYKMQQAAWVVR